MQKGGSICCRIGALLAILVLASSCGSAPTTPTQAPAAVTPAASAPAGSAAQASTPGPRKPTGSLVVQEPALRNVPMVPEFGAAGNNFYYGLLYDHLTRLEYDEAKGVYTLQPEMATSWEVTPDLKTWTFHLRKGLQWPDGNGEFTAEDVKYTVEKVILNPQVVNVEADGAVIRRVIDSVEVTDPATVIIHLKTPYGSLDGLLSDLWTSPPVSKKYVEKVGLEAANKQPIGTGPYNLSELKVGEYLKLQAKGEHWRQTGYYQTITFREIPEASTALAMLKTGDADIIAAPMFYRDEIVQAGFQARLNPGTEYTYALFSGLWSPTLFPEQTSTKVPWRDIKVRQAMNLAIDRDAIIKTLYLGEAKPAPVVLFMPGTTGYNPDLKPYPYDPAKAKQLLADAGYPKGFDANMMIYPWTHAPEIPELGQAIAQFWSKIGINARMTWTDYTTMTGIFNTKKDPLMVNPMGFTRMAVPEVHLDSFFNPKGRFGIDAPDIWALTQQMQVEADPAKRDAIGREIGQKIYDGNWIIPIAWSAMPYYVNPKKVGDWPFLKGQPYILRLQFLKQPGA